MKYVYSLIALCLGFGAFLYYKSESYDPNVYDTVINVRVSDTESKDFDFDINRPAFRFIEELIGYIKKSDLNAPSVEIKIKAEGKKPIKSYFSRKAKQVNSGVYSIIKSEGGYAVFFNGDVEDIINEGSLEKAVNICLAGAWNSMGTEITYTYE